MWEEHMEIENRLQSIPSATKQGCFETSASFLRQHLWEVCVRLFFFFFLKISSISDGGEVEQQLVPQMEVVDHVTDKSCFRARTSTLNKMSMQLREYECVNKNVQNQSNQTSMPRTWEHYGWENKLERMKTGHCHRALYKENVFVYIGWVYALDWISFFFHSFLSFVCAIMYKVWLLAKYHEIFIY